METKLSAWCRDNGVAHGLTVSTRAAPLFLANVNSRSRSLYAIARLSVCLLSVTLVCPTQAVEIFDNIFMAFGTLAIRWHPLKISWRSVSWRSSQGNLSARELNTRGVAKYSDFGPVDGYISETVQDRR